MVLFVIAYRGDAKPAGHVSRFQPLIYTLSLTVYCTSWTFYGAVGNAAHNGWDYFSIYLGPIIVFVFFFPFISKLISVSKRHKTTSIADFIATRYGKSNRLAAAVTLFALIGSLPYIALQIKAISGAYDTLTDTAYLADPTTHVFPDTAFALTLILAVFAIFFGARTIDASEHHRGMLLAISFESVIKLLSFIVMAVLAWQIISAVVAMEDEYRNSYQLMMSPFGNYQLDTAFLTKTILAASAIILLPRQFHVLAVEARGGESFSRWGLPLYLLLFSLAVVPITAAGALVAAGLDNADLFVLILPMHEQSTLLALISYLGGFSAATGMVIVATIALSTMVSNDLIFPLLVRYKKNISEGYFHSTLLRIRQATIFTLMVLAYGYFYLGGTEKSLQSIGLISFAAAIQFMPSVVGGLYWRKGHRNGALAGLLAGFFIWLYCLLLPSFANSAWMPDFFTGLIADKNALLNPTQLFGVNFHDSLTHGVVWSLTLNIAAYVVFSLRAKPSLTDRLQATAYVDNADTTGQDAVEPGYRFHVSDLYELCSRFTGETRTQEYFHEHGYYLAKRAAQPADQNVLELSERLLASSIGTATAKHLIRTAALPSKASGASLFELIDQTGQAIEFNRELLQVTLDHIGQAVSVVDQDLRLVAWNRQYTEIFDYPSGSLRVGRPIEELIRYNVERGYGPVFDSDVESRINKRLHYLKHGQRYVQVRDWQNGKVIQTEGARMPDGGYITTYTDITPLKMAERNLAATNETLEAKVNERTQMLSRVNQQLEEVINTKTHFLAAASHDLVQPLGASKLYMGALLEDLADDKEKRELAGNALGALKTAESLLRSLLDLSKLDSGVLKPDISCFGLQELFNSIENEFTVIAAEKGLELRVYATDFSTESDRSLLLSILQNLVANAIRYTKSGRVVVLCRREGANAMRVEVRDSGPGIPVDKQDEIFQAFKRLDSSAAKEGVGLGLAIGREAANLLGHTIRVRSRPDAGSTFSVRIPRISATQLPEPALVIQPYKKRWLEGASILCVDDDREILRASRSLLERWGANITCMDDASKLRELLDDGTRFDVVLMDYQLGVEDTGLDLLRYCKQVMGDGFVGVLVTAEQDSSLEQKANELGFRFLAKPVEPAKLRTLLQSGDIL